MKIIQILLALCAIVSITTFIHGFGLFTGWYYFPLYTNYSVVVWMISVIGLFAIVLTDVFDNGCDACYYYWMKFVNSCSRNGQ